MVNGAVQGLGVGGLGFGVGSCFSDACQATLIPACCPYIGPPGMTTTGDKDAKRANEATPVRLRYAATYLGETNPFTTTETMPSMYHKRPSEWGVAGLKKILLVCRGGGNVQCMGHVAVAVVRVHTCVSLKWRCSGVWDHAWARATHRCNRPLAVRPVHAADPRHVFYSHMHMHDLADAHRR